MKNFSFKFYLFVLLVLCGGLFAQQMEISGKVVDKATQNGLGVATVILYPSGVQTKTNENGNFFLEAEKTPACFFRF